MSLSSYLRTRYTSSTSTTSIFNVPGKDKPGNFKRISELTNSLVRQARANPKQDIKPTVKDPITTHPMARKFFYLGMGIVATSLVMRSYNIPYYNILLYLDIVIQLVALGISFSTKPLSSEELSEEILDL